MKRPPSPAAAVFDLDGTLLDSLHDLADAANRALRQLDCPTHPVDAYRTFVGDGIVNLFRRALPAGRVDEDHLARAVSAMEAAYREGWRTHSTPYPGIHDLLEALLQRGVSLAVLSNKPHPFTTAVVEHFFPSIPFVEVRGAMPDQPIKPDPAGARAVAGSLGCDGKACWYLGDTDTDMQTAVNAGFTAIGVTWGFRSAGELQAHGAEWIIDHPRDLLPLIEPVD